VGAGIDWMSCSISERPSSAWAGFIAAMAFFVPPLGLTDDEDVDKNALYLMQQFLDAAAERELEEKETEQVNRAGRR